MLRPLLGLGAFALINTLLSINLVQAKTFNLTTATLKDINTAFDARVINSQELVEQYLARINAYDDKGPKIGAILSVNTNALDLAKQLDIERIKSGRRSLLHGIPIVLKDNIDTKDMPTTAGSFILRHSVPPDDAFIVKRLREAGAIILAKTNMSEFASGAAISSLGGFTRNPHNPLHSPSGSSGGTAAAIAAAFSVAGLGTDTGQSVRAPASANGIIGLKTTHGLVSRDGIIPLARSFDTVGPMARSVYDLAVLLNVITGIDQADESTLKSQGKVKKDYTEYLTRPKGKEIRLGVARNFMAVDSDVTWIANAAFARMEDADITMVDVDFPDWLIKQKGAWYTAIRWREFRAQLPEYLASLDEKYPQNFEELIEQAIQLTHTYHKGLTPNPGRWRLLQLEQESGAITDYEYQAIYRHALPLLKSIVEGMMKEKNLDAIVYPTLPQPMGLIDSAPVSLVHPVPHALDIASMTGFPELVIPIGFTSLGMPISLSFLGQEFDEHRLLALGYFLEQETKALILPIATPPLSE